MAIINDQPRAKIQTKLPNHIIESSSSDDDGTTDPAELFDSEILAQGIEIQLDSDPNMAKMGAGYPKKLHIVCKILRAPYEPGYNVKKDNKNSKLKLKKTTNFESDSDDGMKRKRKKKNFDELLQSDDSSSDNWNSDEEAGDQ